MGDRIAPAANNPAAVSGNNPGQVFVDRLREIHPADSEQAFLNMRAAGGEVAYARMLGNQTRQWIAAHPGEALRLAFRHLKQVFAPEPWQFAVFGTGKMTRLRSMLATVAGVGGTLGLLLALIMRRPGWIYPAVFIAVPALALAPFQPVPRYTYFFYPILAFAAADLISSPIKTGTILAKSHRQVKPGFEGATVGDARETRARIH